jgi:glycosyltransferase involved in cell wall biosynthesis
MFSHSPTLEAPASLLFVCNEDLFFLLHIQSLAKAALQRGYAVAVAAQDTGRAEEIRDLGMDFHPLRFQRSGLRCSDRALQSQLRALYGRCRPQVVHHFGLKLIWEGLRAAHALGLSHTVNSVTGLGYLFTAKSLWVKPLQQGLLWGLRLLLARGDHRVVVQNEEDFQYFTRQQVCRSQNLYKIGGAGVNLVDFSSSPEVNSALKTVVFPARMIAHKGLREFLAAARILLEEQQPGVMRLRFVLAGAMDPQNRASLDTREILTLCDRPGLEWWGFVEDMPALYRAAHVVVLPSYREGCPKALLEACASGRPVVTTDVAGCRDVVRHGVNGLLVRPYAVEDLVEALRELLGDPEKRESMGQQGRAWAEQCYDENLINRQILELYVSLGLPKRQERIFLAEKYEEDCIS